MDMNQPTGETMGEGSTMPPTMPKTTPDAPKPSGGMEVPIPLEALAMPGEDDKPGAPKDRPLTGGLKR